MRFNELGSRYTKAEFMREGQRRRIPVGVLETADSILFNENLKARDYFISIDHPVLGSYLYPGAPALMTESPHQIGRPAPLLGEHNEEIYRLLGYSDMAIHDMQAQGVI